MPLNGKMTGNMFTPIVTNNNAFNVKIIAPNSSMEDKGNATKNSRDTDKIKVGDMVSGEIIKDGGKEIGKVVAILREEGEIVGYKILDDDGEEVILDPSTVSRQEQNTGSDPGKTYSKQNESLELKSSSLVPNFNDWLNSTDSGY
jgi:hypothetical protein